MVHDMKTFALWAAAIAINVAGLAGYSYLSPAEPYPGFSEAMAYAGVDVSYQSSFGSTARQFCKEHKGHLGVFFPTTAQMFICDTRSKQSSILERTLSHETAHVLQWCLAGKPEDTALASLGRPDGGFSNAAVNYGMSLAIENPGIPASHIRLEIEAEHFGNTVSVEKAIDRVYEVCE